MFNLFIFITMVSRYDISDKKVEQAVLGSH